MTRKFSIICECSGIFLNIINSGDPVFKEALTVSVARERLGHGDPVVKKAFIVGIAREYA